jgi:hypothetical protein
VVLVRQRRARGQQPAERARPRGVHRRRRGRSGLRRRRGRGHCGKNGHLEVGETERSWRWRAPSPRGGGGSFERSGVGMACRSRKLYACTVTAGDERRTAVGSCSPSSFRVGPLALDFRVGTEGGSRLCFPCTWAGPTCRGRNATDLADHITGKFLMLLQLQLKSSLQC